MMRIKMKPLTDYSLVLFQLNSQAEILSKHVYDLLLGEELAPKLYWNMTAMFRNKVKAVDAFTFW